MSTETPGSHDAEPSAEHDGPRGEDAWQAARRRVADRNARVRKLGKQQRREHEERIAAKLGVSEDDQRRPEGLLETLVAEYRDQARFR